METLGIRQQQRLSQNLGFTDRQIRTVLGTLMIATPMITVSETIGSWSIIMLASIPVLTTAIVGWDPLYALLGKTTYVDHEEMIQQRNWSYANIGIIDRGIRLGVGLILLYSLMTTITITTGMAFTLMAIPLIVSAFTAWDPIYAGLGINSLGSRMDAAAAEPGATEKTLAELYEFPQPQEVEKNHRRAA